MKISLLLKIVALSAIGALLAGCGSSAEPTPASVANTSGDQPVPTVAGGATP